MMSDRGIIGLALLAALLGQGFLSAAAPASAQILNFASQNSEAAIEIYADDGIEWQQDNMIFLARGNANAVRGDVAVHADLLRAHYQENNGGDTVIKRLDAVGHVRIVTPTETAYGEKGVYDIDNAIFVLSGGKVRLVAGEDEITADRQLEYWELKQMAVARGNAQAVRANKKLRANVLVAYFRKTSKGKNEIHRIEAFESVRMETAGEKVTADRSVYNVKSGIATLTGSVTIIRGSNRLDGCSAKMNLNTGISTLYSCSPSQAGGKRVHGLIKPSNVKKK
jgi:lipopolysaccharide export system protein LptA